VLTLITVKKFNLNEVKFLENVQKIHLNPGEFSIYSAIPDAEVRENLKSSSNMAKILDFPRLWMKFAKMLSVAPGLGC
jgi:hypothetical protein